MTMLKVQTWRPDTHPGHIVEFEWDYDMESGRDAGRDYRRVSLRYPMARAFIATLRTEVAQEHYKKLVALMANCTARPILVESQDVEIPGAGRYSCSRR